MPSFKQLPPGPIYVHCAIQNSKLNDMCLPPSINQSTPALVSSISPQSSSDLDTDQGDIIDKTIKQAAQSVNQLLLKTSTCNPISSLTQNLLPTQQYFKQRDNLQLKTKTHSLKRNTQPIHTHQSVSLKNSITHSNTSFKQAKQNQNEHRHVITLTDTTKQNSTGIKPQWLMQI